MQPAMNRPPKTKVFLEGRYRKLSRDLPQTVFFCPECKGHPRRSRGCEPDGVRRGPARRAPRSGTASPRDVDTGAGAVGEVDGSDR